MEVCEPVLSGVDAKAQMKMEPSVSWSPDLNAGGANARGCTVWGNQTHADYDLNPKKKREGCWPWVSYSSVV